MKNTRMDRIMEALSGTGDICKNCSAQEINEIIAKLEQVMYYAKQREREELRRKRQEEKERREKEEKEKREAHIQEVTCMDLPLDWENLFDSDVRTQGVHAESIPDALVTPR